MRKNHTVQCSIFDLFCDHDIGQELKAISTFLDRHPELISWAASDLHLRDVYDTGRQGLSAESVLRCALLKQMRELSYEELAFHLCDSASFQAFARLSNAFFPKKSTLQSTISRIKPETWERINQVQIREAISLRVERAQKIRIDSTVTESTVHDPTDSRLLQDSVRVMVRLLVAGRELPGNPPIEFCNHSRLANKRAHKIFHTKGMEEDKVGLYVDLIRATFDTMTYLQAAVEVVEKHGTDLLPRVAWKAQVDHFIPLIQRVIDQTQRRVLMEEHVPAKEKLFSIFEDHTDIIIKGERDIQYGHKLNLTSGSSGLILDVVIEEGNPTDIERLKPMVKRHIEHFGVVPRQLAADGGYASEDNLKAMKGLGVKDVAFHKKRGLEVEDMVKSQRVYKSLRNFRAGIESNISCLKRAYGLSRCTWKGWQHFKSYVWSSVVAYNLTTLARLQLA